MQMNALTTEALVKAAPSVAQMNPHRGCSDKYRMIRTIDIIDQLEPLGWRPVRAREARCISPDRIGYQKHIIALRHKDSVKQEFKHRPDAHRIEKDQPNFFEVCITNSHDRSSQFQTFIGIFRQICSNGLVVSKGMFAHVNERHINISPEQIIANVVKMGGQMSKVMDAVDSMSRVVLSERERLDFGEYALIGKYGDMAQSPIGPEKVIEVRRNEDAGNDLWRTFNVIQENLIQGGQIQIERLDRTGRGYNPSQAINSLDRQIKINELLWDRAASLLLAKS